MLAFGSRCILTINGQRGDCAGRHPTSNVATLSCSVLCWLPGVAGHPSSAFCPTDGLFFVCIWWHHRKHHDNADGIKSQETMRTASDDTAQSSGSDTWGCCIAMQSPSFCRCASFGCTVPAPCSPSQHHSPCVLRMCAGVCCVHGCRSLTAGLSVLLGLCELRLSGRVVLAPVKGLEGLTRLSNLELTQDLQVCCV